MPYFDPNGLARSNGFAEGLNNGRREGRQQGYDEGRSTGYQNGYHNGYQNGYQAGNEAGWNAGVEAGNANMLEQMAYTREHVAEKEALATQLAYTRALLQLTQERLAAQEAAAGAPAASEHASWQQITGLLAERSRDTVLIAALCSTLEELTMTDREIAHATWDALDYHYHEKLKPALAKSTLASAPHQDPGLAAAHPGAQRLLAALLGDGAEGAGGAVDAAGNTGA